MSKSTFVLLSTHDGINVMELPHYVGEMKGLIEKIDPNYSVTAVIEGELTINYTWTSLALDRFLDNAKEDFYYEENKEKVDQAIESLNELVNQNENNEMESWSNFRQRNHFNAWTLQSD